MLATVSPADIHYNKTISTLRYANHTKNIMNKPSVNEVYILDIVVSVVCLLAVDIIVPTNIGIVRFGCGDSSEVSVLVGKPNPYILHNSVIYALSKKFKWFQLLFASRLYVFRINSYMIVILWSLGSRLFMVLIYGVTSRDTRILLILLLSYYSFRTEYNQLLIVDGQHSSRTSIWTSKRNVIYVHLIRAFLLVWRGFNIISFSLFDKAQYALRWTCAIKNVFPL